MGPGFVLQLICSEKFTKMLVTQQPVKLDKNKHSFGILRIIGNFLFVFNKI
jgi:hypothetical protein